jgi:aspartyl-tRNA(Asn)/glutamyl-tRNA(Gln) amidotransferase subunit A
LTVGETTLAGLRSALQAGDVSSVELVQRALETADAHDEALGVFVSRFDEQALEAAADADARRSAGHDLPLLGLPIGVKDILTTREGETTGQSLVLDRAWGVGDAPCIARLRAAGAIVIGKTTTMEFALGTPDETKPFPIPKNPWSPSHWTGGSSSGSASGVATGMMAGAVGTDTGASIRMPAALCGVTGLKPTFGLVPKSGCVPLAYSMDHVGPMARTARDCRLLLQAMAGHDPSDSSSADRPVPDLVGDFDHDLRGVRIGVDQLSRFSGAAEDPALEGLLAHLMSVLEDAGAELVPIELPYYRELAAVGVITVLAEALAYHTPDVRSRWGDYFASTRLGLAHGAFVGAADYVQAQRVRRVAQLEVSALFSRVDLVVTPTVSRAAPLLADAGPYVGTFFAGRDLAFHTAYWNLLGLPAASVPIGFNAEGLPLAGQLIGRPFEDGAVLDAAEIYQRATDWHLRPCTAATASTEGASDSPPMPSGTEPDPSDLVAGLLQMHQLAPDAVEVGMLEAGLPVVRESAELLHAFKPARYESPSLTFTPDGA